MVVIDCLWFAFDLYGSDGSKLFLIVLIGCVTYKLVLIAHVWFSFVQYRFNRSCMVLISTLFSLFILICIDWSYMALICHVCFFMVQIAILWLLAWSHWDLIWFIWLWLVPCLLDRSRKFLSDPVISWLVLYGLAYSPLFSHGLCGSCLILICLVWPHLPSIFLITPIQSWLGLCAPA